MDRQRADAVRRNLAEIAQALNALRDLGVTVSARHGAVITDYGFLLPCDDGSWHVRMKLYDPQCVPVGDPDDD
jgi:hypothetical protein